MIIDSKQYDGLCLCGRTHQMETRLCVIESGCLKRLAAYLEEYGMQGYCVAVYDENTYKATAGRHPKVDREVVLPAADLHANEHGVALLKEQLPRETEYLIAVGSGTIHDITRYCAFERKIDFVSCPTAASVDGFCSSVAAMTWHGCKKTLTAVAPKIVVADIEIIKNAPIRLAKSGFGDMVGKYVALTDWKIASILANEFYCERIAGITLEATREVVASIDGILAGEENAYEKLMCGLILSGLAMQMMGNSRPASGAEHHISHLIEMEPVGLNLHSDALHGEKVGVGTLLVMGEYQRIIGKSGMKFADYQPYPEMVIAEVFGKEKLQEIIQENQNDAAANITGDSIQLHFERITEEIKKLPPIEDLEKLYNHAGIKSSLMDIGVPVEKSMLLLKYAPMVRNRLTLLRLIRGSVM